jgi:hypothetical protein
MPKPKITIEELRGDKPRPMKIMDNESLSNMINVNKTRMKTLKENPSSYWQFYQFLNGVNPKVKKSFFKKKKN